MVSSPEAETLGNKEEEQEVSSSENSTKVEMNCDTESKELDQQLQIENATTSMDTDKPMNDFNHGCHNNGQEQQSVSSEEQFQQNLKKKNK